ncbi:phosphopantothenoylcysteine decarboxylase, partial [Rhodococcus hoagii]|nr:phosphopantothenoylcysteine decarboxylase [Prescottella equi]
DHARTKLAAAKGLATSGRHAVGDGKAFEVDHNDGWLLGSDGTETAIEPGSKSLMASRVLDALAGLLVPE